MLHETLINLVHESPLLYGVILGSILSCFILISRVIPYNPISVYRASHRLKKLKIIDDPRTQFWYLRFTNPFIFEEMVLTAFKKSGCRIRRNKKYIGDGGIDGVIYLDGRRTLIQCKRYKSYIDPQHVLDFQAICLRSGVNGLFIHTGKTGSRAWEYSSDRVKIISGSKLLKLMIRHEY